MTKDEVLFTLEKAQSLFNAGDLAGYVTTIYAPDARFPYYPPGLPHGREGATIFYTVWLQAFPDSQLFFDDIMYGDDRLAVRYHLTATHQGEFNGIPATGKAIRLSGITIMHWEAGQVIERWDNSDQLGLLQQLGVMPA